MCSATRKSAVISPSNGATFVDEKGQARKQKAPRRRRRGADAPAGKANRARHLALYGCRNLTASNTDMETFLFWRHGAFSQHPGDR
jgi:hypothetical protein